MSEHFICLMCSEKFEKAWSDEEAETESRELFGEIPEEERAVVCDDCFNKIHPDKFPLATKITKAAIAAANKEK